MQISCRRVGSTGDGKIKSTGEALSRQGVPRLKHGLLHWRYPEFCYGRQKVRITEWYMRALVERRNTPLHDWCTLAGRTRWVEDDQGRKECSGQGNATDKDASGRKHLSCYGSQPSVPCFKTRISNWLGIPARRQVLVASETKRATRRSGSSR